MHDYEIKQAGVTDIGNVRTVNEDHLLADGDLYIVADGMGGRGHGEVASRVAVDTLHEAFGNDPTVDGLVAAIHQANDRVLEAGRALPTEPSASGMGTTIAAVASVMTDDGPRLAIANVGDSRIYRHRGGRLERLSSDHSRVADLVRAGVISDEEAAGHPERHILTMAVGVETRIEPFVDQIDPERGDRLMLCSDGLFNELGQTEIGQVLYSVGDAGEASRRLVALANERGGNDNITVMVLDIE